jgi:hypothetical protein
VFTDDIRPSADSGGSDDTRINVFLQDGHRKQFRAHLRKAGQKIGGFGSHNILALLSPNITLGTSNKQFGQWYPPTGDASVAPDRVAFLAEVEAVDFVVRVRG